jgi:hypothetical protein
MLTRTPCHPNFFSTGRFVPVTFGLKLDDEKNKRIQILEGYISPFFS